MNTDTMRASLVLSWYFPTPDGYIAAIATSQGFVVASRDTALFEAGGVTVVNHWE